MKKLIKLPIILPKKYFLIEKEESIYFAPIKINLTKCLKQLSKVLEVDGKPYSPSIFEKEIIQELER